MLKRASIIIAIVLVGFFVSVQWFIPKNYIYGKKDGLLRATANMMDFLNSPIHNDEAVEIPQASIQIEYKEEESKGNLNVGDQEFGFTLEKEKSTDWLDFPEYHLKFSKKNYFHQGRYYKAYPATEGLAGPMISQAIAKDLQLVHSKYELYELENNGKKALYYFREKHSKDLTEKQFISNGICFDLKLSKKNIKGKKIAEDNEKAPTFIKNKLALLDLVIDTNAVQVASDFFDLDYMARYYVYAHLMGDISNDNNSWFYRLTNAKFYPIAYHNKRIKNIKSHDKHLKAISKDRIWNYLFQVPEFSIKVTEAFNSITKDYISKYTAINKKYSAVFSAQTMGYSQGQINYDIEETSNKLEANYARFISGETSVELEALAINQIDYKVITDSTSFLSTLEYPNLLEHLKAIGAQINDKVISFEGEINVSTTTIIPAGYDVIIKPGTKIHMGHKVSLLSYSSMQMQGTSENPITISGEKDSPFGLFGIVGNEDKTSVLTHVNVMHGSEDYVNGIYMSGAINIYHENASLSDVHVNNNNADDGLNIKYGKIDIHNCVFEKNYADQVDLDFCKGTVKNSRFSNNEGDSNGDGLDFSGSFILVEGCSFDKFDDKGISVGENTKAVIKNCSFTNNNLGMAIKDLSEITATGCTFVGNGTAFSLYMKKGIFGGSTLHNCNNEVDSESVYQLDNLSKVDEECSDKNLTLHLL